MGSTFLSIWNSKWTLIVLLPMMVIGWGIYVYLTSSVVHSTQSREGSPPAGSTEIRPGESSLEKWLHLVLPSAVLLVEFFMLGRMLQESKEREKESKEREKESKEREKTMDDLNTFRIALGRDNYMKQIESAILRARGEVVFTTATMEMNYRSNEQTLIFSAVKKREGQDGAVSKEGSDNKVKPGTGKDLPHSAVPYKNYVHRGVVAMKPETLPGTIELLFHTKIKLKMSKAMAMTRLRFTVKDDDQAIIGVAEGDLELASDRPSTMSFSVESMMLAMALKDKFEKLWGEASCPWKFLDEFITVGKKGNPRYSRREVRRWLGTDKTGVTDEFLEKKSEAYKKLSEDGEPTESDVGS